MKELVKDIKNIKDDVFAIILYGSYIYGKPNIRSDIDVCLVLKTNDENEIKNVYRKTLRLSGKNEKYDIKIFELLSLYIKINIINSGKIIFVKNSKELQEYFYFYKKLWQEQSINWMEKKNLVPL